MSRPIASVRLKACVADWNGEERSNERIRVITEHLKGVAKKGRNYIELLLRISEYPV